MSFGLERFPNPKGPCSYMVYTIKYTLVSSQASTGGCKVQGSQTFQVPNILLSTEYKGATTGMVHTVEPNRLLSKF